MKTAVHPELRLASVTCASCGTSFETRSVAGDLVLEVCSACHPAYTGKTRATAGGSRIERFERRYGRSPRTA
jgi:large subunit ribosomal protein L31